MIVVDVIIMCGPLLLLHLGVDGALLARPFDEPAQGEIVEDVLNALDVVLDGVGALAQNVVLEVEQLEARKEVLDKGADGQGQVKVAEGDGVGGQARQVLRQVDDGQEVLFYGDVEGITVLEVCGDCRGELANASSLYAPT